MRYSMLGWAIFFFKMFLDRRRHRGAQEFKFHWRLGSSDHHRVEVVSREGNFSATCHLRKRTSDLAAFEQVFLNNDYNLRRLARWDDINALYEKRRNEGTPAILDLGSNAGFAALYFTKNWPEACVLAVEPDSGNYRALCDNTKNHNSIEPVHAAVANSNGQVRITNPDEAEWAYRTETLQSTSDDAIPAKTVQTLVDSASNQGKLCIPFIIKIDIEGFEDNLFAQNTDWMNYFPVIIIEPHDWMLPRSGSSHNFLAEIAKGKWDIILLGENLCCISNEHDRPLTWHKATRETR